MTLYIYRYTRPTVPLYFASSRPRHEAHEEFVGSWEVSA